MLVQRGDAGLPHRLAVLVAEQVRALQQVLVIRIDPAPDMAGLADPRAGLDVDLLAGEIELRTSLVQLDDGALRFLEVDRFVRQFAQRPELEDERADLGRIGAGAGGLSGA